MLRHVSQEDREAGHLIRIQNPTDSNDCADPDTRSTGRGVNQRRLVTTDYHFSPFCPAAVFAAVHPILDSK